TSSYDGETALAGMHQRMNAALALAALRAAKTTTTKDAIVRGLTSVQWPARFQRWDDRVVIDGAHNSAGALALAQTWSAEFGEQRAAILLAILKDKNAQEILSALAPIASRFLFPHVRSERAISPNELLTIAQKISPEIPSEISFD